MAEQQAMWWTALILQKMPLPQTPGHYRLLTTGHARIQYGVDYSTYMSILARDFGGAPDLFELWRTHGLKILFVYCFGASFVSLYRLMGPFATPLAVRVAETEVLDTIMRRGVLGNFFFGFVPMFFYGILNSVSYSLLLLGFLKAEQVTTNVDMEFS